jgi:hypothetical protein
LSVESAGLLIQVIPLDKIQWHARTYCARVIQHAADAHLSRESERGFQHPLLLARTSVASAASSIAAGTRVMPTGMLVRHPPRHILEHSAQSPTTLHIVVALLALPLLFISLSLSLLTFLSFSLWMLPVISHEIHMPFRV